MTTTDDALTATLNTRGLLAGPFADDVLDELEADLALAAKLLHDELDFGAYGYPATIVDLRTFVGTLAGLDHALAALASLQPLIDRRRQELAEHGVDWCTHVDDVIRWRDGNRARRRKPSAA